MYVKGKSWGGKKKNKIDEKTFIACTQLNIMLTLKMSKVQVSENQEKRVYSEKKLLRYTSSIASVHVFCSFHPMVISADWQNKRHVSVHKQLSKLAKLPNLVQSHNLL